MTMTLSQRLAKLDTATLSPGNASIVAALESIGDALAAETGEFLPCDLQQSLGLVRLRQSHRLEEDRIHTLTYVLLPGVDPGALESKLIEEPWSWWEHGKVSRWRRLENGGAAFILAPVWPFVPSKVGIELEPRSAREEPVPWRKTIPIACYEARFSADFDGPGRYEILTLEGGSALRSIWDGVRRLGIKKLMPLSMILRMHLDAEAGTAGFPLPKGTGYPGLVKSLTASASRL